MPEKVEDKSIETAKGEKRTTAPEKVEEKASETEKGRET